MSAWDPESLSKEFLRRTEQADNRMRNCQRRVSYSPGHKSVYHMACEILHL
jgi:hypothetical protein